MNNKTQHWATPIYRANVNDSAFVQSLLNLAAMIKMKAPTVEEYGTAQVFDDLRYKEPTATRLFDTVQHHVDQFTRDLPNMHQLDAMIKLQLCILESGQVTGYHGHDYSFLTGIVYLTPQNTGLILHDPRVNAARGYPKQFASQFADVVIVPEPGDIVMFPSYVYHSTMVHSALQSRVVMPFNVMQARR